MKNDKMTIKLTQGIVGDRFAHNPGDVIQWDRVEAMRMIKAGIAVPEKLDTKEVR